MSNNLRRGAVAAAPKSSAIEHREIPTVGVTPPPRTLRGYPKLQLTPELWMGTTGRMVWSDKHIANGRWAVHTMAFIGEDRTKVSNFLAMKRLHTKLCAAADIEVENHELVVARPDSEQLATVRAMMEPREDSWPVEKTAVVVEDADRALQYGVHGSFFRFYRNTDPSNPGGVFFPDSYAQHLGDPEKLWPSQHPGCYTDGQWMAMLASPDAVRVAAMAHLREALRVPSPVVAPATGKPELVGTATYQKPLPF